MGAEIDLDGVSWPTTEHYFQAQKFIGTPFVQKIQDSSLPRDAFTLSRDPSISYWRRNDWEDVKMDVMRKAVFAKFTQHQYLRTMLVETESRTLVERSPHDSFWGDGGNGTGQNHLGKLLMELRAKLQGNDVECDGIPVTEKKAVASNSGDSSFTTDVCGKDDGNLTPRMNSGHPSSEELRRSLSGESEVKMETDNSLGSLSADDLQTGTENKEDLMEH